MQWGFRFLFLWVCLVPVGLVSASRGDSGQPGAFLRAGVGARPAGLGQAFVAVADDANSTYWNPAGMAQLSGLAVSSMVALMSLERKFNQLALAMPLGLSRSVRSQGLPESFQDMGAWGGWGCWGISWINFSLGNDFEGRQKDTASYYLFGDQQNAFYLSHGRALANWLSVGANIKYVQRTLESHEAKGYGLDLGLLALLHEHLRCGVSMADLASGQTWDTGYQERFPEVFRLGLASPWYKGAWVVSGQADGVSGREPRFALGTEAWLYRILGLRGGWHDGDLNAGASVQLLVYKVQIRVDYSYSFENSGLGDTQRLSLGGSF
jgi:hypothetical protein